jgi:hypothetical protein
MSNSFKHAPVLTEGYGSNHRRTEKRLASRAVRHLPVDAELGNNADYRRHYPQYNICDFRFYIKTPRSMKIYQIYMK